jgi:TPP-dependent indolepyruvate ferredoxin oxidoreductase alpha subunit
MNSAVRLEDEVKKLRAANIRVGKKKQKRKSYVGDKEVESVAEVQQAREERIERVEEEVIAVEENTSTEPVRPPRMCSMCRSTEHTTQTCNLRGNFNYNSLLIINLMRC